MSAPSSASDRRDDLLVTHLAEIATPLGSEARAGEDQGKILRLSGRGDDAPEALCRDGRIAFVGSRAERRRRFGDLDDTPRLDGGGGTLVPGFVDAHTHLPWAGSRQDEFARRLAGATYEEIAAAGGGILATVGATREANRETLAANVVERLDRMLAHGTTSAEAKSGYGLRLDVERRQLEAIHDADRNHPVELTATLLAAHETPPEYRDDRERWLSIVCEEITPAVAEAGLATFCDVFCERGVFSADESRRVLEAGIRHGLVARLHADEFQPSGGAELAGELGARSADHLLAISDRGIEAMAEAGVIGGLLPGVAFFLIADHQAPARRLIEAGVPLMVATDCNPGSSHTESLVTCLQLAVFQAGLSIPEALTAITLNGAACLGRAADIGSIEEGKQADLVILDEPDVLHLAYHFGVDPVATVVKAGRVVYRRGGRVDASGSSR